MTTTELTQRVKTAALDLGFAAVGIASAERAAEGQRLREWLARGFHADMAWMENPGVREAPAVLFPGARSVVVAGFNTWSPAVAPRAGEGRIARYALGPDYHRLLKKKLLRLLRALQALVPCGGRVTVDAHPLLERAFAQRAGLGWIGKHGCLITPGAASWLLLGEVIVDCDLTPDAPHANRCGSCSRCAPSCPTGAIVEPGLIDANRCIAYLTIEHRGPIARPLRPLIGNWLFGCDLCQEACPWDRFAGGGVSGSSAAAGPAATSRGTQPANGFAGRVPATIRAVEFLAHDEASFRAAYAGTSLMRTGRDRMARNAAIVLGNLRPPEALPSLVTALGDGSALVRGHAAWALGRYGAREVLTTRLAVEGDASVREEITAALSFPEVAVC